MDLVACGKEGEGREPWEVSDLPR